LVRFGAGHRKSNYKGSGQEFPLYTSKSARDRTTLVIFLGIDGGGSKTSCVIGDDSSLLGKGTSAGSNVIRVGERQARESLSTAVRQACAAANVSAAQIERTCVGVAGGALPEISAVVRGWLSEFVGGEIEVVGDMVISVHAAFGRGPGVIVIAGTGSIAYGRNSEGEIARAGGWGFAISDEGSWHWVGRSAVGACMRAYDEGQPERSQALLESIMKCWAVRTREQVVLAANAALHVGSGPDFAALLPAVLSAADAGDVTARAVLNQAGTELAVLAKIVIDRIFANAGDVPVAVSGGVFSNCDVIRQVFYDRLQAVYPQVVFNKTSVDPVMGALDLARKPLL
jgi:N-acetylglucosamine kinase-like BadF-type ATPase